MTSAFSCQNCISLFPASFCTPRPNLPDTPGEGNGTPLQYSCLENPMDGGAWKAAVHGVARSRARLNDFPFTFHFYALEKEMAIHSSVLACRIPGRGEPSGLLSLGSHRVGHDWSDLAAAAAKSEKRCVNNLCSPFDPIFYECFDIWNQENKYFRMNGLFVYSFQFK